MLWTIKTTTANGPLEDKLVAGGEDPVAELQSFLEELQTKRELMGVKGIGFRAPILVSIEEAR